MNTKSPNNLLGSMVRNSIFTGLGTLSTMVIGFIFAGLSIRYLGAERSGYLLSLQAFIVLSTLIGGLGLATPSVRKIAIAYSSEDVGSIKNIVGSVAAVNIAIGIIMAIIIMAFFSYLFELSKLSEVYRDDAFWATLLVVATFIASQINNSWQAVYQALQRYDIITLFSTVFGLLSGILGLTILSWHPTMSYLMGVGFVLSIVEILWDAYFMRRLIGCVPMPKWIWPEIRSMSKFGGWTFISSLGGLLFTNVDRLVMTSFLGSAVLPYYAFPQRLFFQVHTAIASQTQFLFPTLAAYGDDAITQIRRVEDRLRWFIALLSAFIYTGVALTGPIVFRLLIGEEFSRLATLPLMLACVQGFFQAQNILPYYTSYALGKGIPNAMTQLLNGLLVVSFSVILIPIYGYIGASIAQLSIIAVVIVHIFWVNWEVREKLWDFRWCVAYISPLMLSLIWISTTYILSNFVNGGILASVLDIAVGGIMGLLIVFLLEGFIFASYNRINTLIQALSIPLSFLKKFNLYRLINKHSL